MSNTPLWLQVLYILSALIGATFAIVQVWKRRKKRTYREIVLADKPVRRYTFEERDDQTTMEKP